MQKSIEMFLHQEYPIDRMEMLIFSDSPTDDFIPVIEDMKCLSRIQDALRSQLKPVRYEWFSTRFPSMPTKYNEMLKAAKGDVLVVWDDDDEYTPWHILAHVKTLEQSHFSKPSRVKSDYPGYIIEEDAAGRFHGSIAFTRELCDKIGGWPESDRETFDQEMISALGKPVDTLSNDPRISYTFKWHTGHYHMQHAMGKPGWYDKMPQIAGAR